MKLAAPLERVTTSTGVPGEYQHGAERSGSNGRMVTRYTPHYVSQRPPPRFVGKGKQPQSVYVAKGCRHGEMVGSDGRLVSYERRANF